MVRIFDKLQRLTSVPRERPIRAMHTPADPAVPSPPGCTPTLGEGGTAAGTGLPAVKSEALLGGAVELRIDHHGVVYRLRQTALGKLILTK
jgi:hemin uptake protein HemP